MTRTSSTQRLLVLAGPHSLQSGLIDLLKTQHDVVLADSIDAALNELRGGGIDAVFSDSADFLPLERAMASQQSGLILDTIGEGICITDEEGQILWANRRMKQWAEPVRDRIRAVCREAYGTFVNQKSPLGTEEHGAAATQGIVPQGSRSRKFSFSFDESQYFELFCSPVVDASRKITQIVAICWDATSGRRLQQKIDAIDQAGRELVRLEGEAIAKLNVGQRLKLLEEKIIKFCRQLMHFDHFAIRLLDRKTNKLELVICVGMPTEAMEVELFAQLDGNGISGYVASTGRSYICADVKTDSRYVTGLSNPGSSLTVPLMLHDKVIGIFNIESQRPSAFTEDDRQFAEIFGRYVAVAINILNLLVVERYNTTGQLASDVSSEIAGPLNDITSETTLLMDDYIGNDDMRKRLQLILDNVSKIRRSVKEVAEGPKTILGADAAGSANVDPVLAGKRVLVADDEPNIRQTIADLLTKYGCKVDTAADGAEACAQLAASPRYDLVLSDIKMPHKNGYEIFAAAQKIGHSPPVILMTGFGYDPAHSIVRAGQEGLAAVLFKPFKVDQLVNEVKKAVQLPRK
jgi:CheY-like chemotaxis protein/putative methionine-R-sulfoxide reductase with GAF domain/PAS domain-containing protein